MAKQWLWAMVCAAPLAGCQTYVARPLHLDSHPLAVQDRDPAGHAVVAFARQLAAERVFADGVDFNAADGLTLVEAEVVALFFNPDLRVARLRAKVPTIGAASAGRWSDPYFQLDVERILESVAHPWVASGTLNFTIPLSGRLGVERDRALAEADVEIRRAYEREANLRAGLRRAWMDWSAVSRRAELTEEYLGDLATLQTRAESLRDAGEPRVRADDRHAGAAASGIDEAEDRRRRPAA